MIRVWGLSIDPLWIIVIVGGIVALIVRSRQN
jgi:hypothetical protein